MMKETPWKEFSKYNEKYRIRARYGIDYGFAARYRQAPHFSITAEIKRWTGRSWEEDSGGMLHEEVCKHFPKLAKYIPWHLVSFSGPMHYSANAKFWYEKIGKPKEKPYEPDAEEAFKNTIVFGAIPGEKLPVGVPWPEVQRWLLERLPKVMDNFKADMKELEVLEG